MKNRFLLGSLFALLMVALLGASNIVQQWTWNSTLNAFQVLMKDGGGTKFVASAKGATDGSAAKPGMIGEVISVGLGKTTTSTATWQGWLDQYIDLPTGTWLFVGAGFNNAGGGISGSYSVLSTDADSDSSDIVLRGIANPGASSNELTVGIVQYATPSGGYGPTVVTTPTRMYLKTYAIGANVIVRINGYFIRIR